MRNNLLKTTVWNYFSYHVFYGHPSVSVQWKNCSLKQEQNRLGTNKKNLKRFKIPFVELLPFKCFDFFNLPTNSPESC